MSSVASTPSRAKEKARDRGASRLPWSGASRFATRWQNVPLDGGLRLPISHVSCRQRDFGLQWSLSESKAIEAVERGARVGDFRAFLSACDPQPLPEPVEGFLISVEQRGAACVRKGSCLLLECVSPQIAETIARDARAGTFCQRTGDRGLVIPIDKDVGNTGFLQVLGKGRMHLKEKCSNRPCASSLHFRESRAADRGF